MIVGLGGIDGDGRDKFKTESGDRTGIELRSRGDTDSGIGDKSDADSDRYRDVSCLSSALESPTQAPHWTDHPGQGMSQNEL
jgi:hypothetical protein